MPKARIGCILLANLGAKIVAIECAKGRGLILPGGKWEDGETFRETAAREFFEETGIRVDHLKLKRLFGGIDSSGWYCYSFMTSLSDYHYGKIYIKEEDLISDFVVNKEGVPKLVFPNEIMSSKFKSYYLEMFDELRRYEESHV